MELSQVNIVFNLIDTLQLEKTTRRTEAELQGKLFELTAELQRRKQRLVVVEEEIRKLIDEREVLQKAIQAGDSTLVQQMANIAELEQDEEALKKLKWDHCTHLRDLLDKDSNALSGPGQWIEVAAELLVDSSGIKIDLDSDDVAKRNSVAGQNTAKAAENIVEFHHQTPPTLKKKERRAIFKLLREESVNIVPKDWKGTALGWIAANGLSSVVQLHRQVYQERQLAIGSKQNLSYQARPGTKIPKRLSGRSASDDGINEADESGRTPLSYAAGGGHKRIVEILLDGGAYIDSRDRKLMTPIEYASMSGHKDIVNLLIKKGADSRPLEKVAKVFNTPSRPNMPSPLTKTKVVIRPHKQQVEKRASVFGKFKKKISDIQDVYNLGPPQRDKSPPNMRRVANATTTASIDRPDLPSLQLPWRDDSS
ncbi:ankyrin [Hyaloscypha hepaticicola]|uniref:Ankyrin n=1 Tax=Hyaloscypha hepaticicola TaxID=2082293 RepID=A0A2J6Q7F8_9HELO|nr:ankyrin [Hyaloscypha hepaticicola]